MWGPCLGRPGPGGRSGKAGVKGPTACPFSPAQQLVEGELLRETPITMVTGFSWHPIGSLLSRSPPQVPLWLLFRGRKREYGERPFLREGELHSKPGDPHQELGGEVD